MKAVMMAIRPEWCEKILNGRKTLEIRKTMPQNIDFPFKCYIYCTQNGGALWKHTLIDIPGFQFVYESTKRFIKNQKVLRNGFVVGEFICKDIEILNQIIFSDGRKIYPIDNDIMKRCCLTYDQIADYLAGSDMYAWSIDNLKIYENPVEPHDIIGNKRIPQSWCYVDRGVDLR